MVLGEYQIVNQLKTAYEMAHEQETAGRFCIGCSTVRLACPNGCAPKPAWATEPDLTAAAENFGRGAGEKGQSELSAGDRSLVLILQRDLPLVPEPFALWAHEAGMPVDVLLERAQEFLDRKIMRRFAAVLRHREAGISANAMGVWAVPEGQQASFGELAARFAAVSHCYLRQAYPDWPFTIFTMVHGRTPEQCEAVLRKISAESGVREYAALYSSTEYKKMRVKYFTPEIAAWENAAAGGPGAAAGHTA